MEKEKILAVIGDGSMTGGLAYEALNNAGQSNRDLIVILNDNQMSISGNVGAISRHLNDIRIEPAYLHAKEKVHNLLHKIPMMGKPLDRAIERVKDSIKYFFVSGIIFEEMGFNYAGPVDGHNLGQLVEVLEKIKKMKGPILLHVQTVKGKGYRYAEQLPWEYHGVGCFDIKTGKSLSKGKKPSYSAVFGQAMVEFGQKYPQLTAISAAMTDGTGLKQFEETYPKRFFDVAIAEQHAVTFAAGLATSGYVPVFAVYSTFLQRAYDQIVHDVCMQKLHVIFAIDRAGIVGADGETHQGLFDLSYLSHIPNLTIMAPKNGQELRQMLQFAIEGDGPFAIRYPRETASTVYEEKTSPLTLGKAELLEEGEEIAIFAYGSMMDVAKEVYDKLCQDGKKPRLVNSRFLKPLDEEMLKETAGKCKLLFTLEDNVKTGGFGSTVREKVLDLELPIKVIPIAFEDQYIEQGTRAQLFERYGMDADHVYQTIVQEMNSSLE